MRTPRSLALAAALALGALAAPVSAQLDLPRSKKPSTPPVEQPAGAPPAQGGDAPAGKDAASGTPQADVRRTDPRLGLPRADKSGQREARNGLDLPPQPGSAPGSPSAPTTPAASPSAAAFVCAEVERSSGPDTSLARQAVETLGALGAEGLVAARGMLASERYAPIVVAARVLLRHGDAADTDLVVQRLQADMPSRAGAHLLDVLVAEAPERVDVPLLVALLDHSRGGVRASAQRALAGRPGLADALPGLLASERSDTRLRALELAATLDDPRRETWLLERLGDDSSQVAHRAATLLAVAAAPELDQLLLACVLRTPDFLDRSAAYALLAIAQREDLTGRAILGEEHVEMLFANMGEARPLVDGACAVALAGIGFRSSAPSRTAWLDREVPHALVRAVSGVRFHSDFSKVQEHAIARLGLITGQDLGGNGLAWRDWWVGAAREFRARRAHIELDPATHTRLELFVRTPEGAYHFVAPEVPLDGDALILRSRDFGERFFLTESESRRLFGALTSHGVFGAERLPGMRGRTDLGLRTLVVAVGDQAKRFDAGRSASEPWLDDVLETARALREQNRWQRWVDPRRYASRYAMWDAERAWWESAASPADRDRRLLALVLGHMAGIDPLQRDEPFAELVRLARRPDVLSADDLPRLVELLRTEPFYSGRVETLAELALELARDVSGPDAPLDAELARTLAQTLTLGFEDAAQDQAVAVLAASTLDVRHGAAKHASPWMRAAAARSLAGEDDEASVTIVRGLLLDAELPVQAAAIRALGESRREGARFEIVARARTSSGTLRAEALRALGRIGGPDARETLTLGLAASDPLVQAAAAEGLGELGDPTTAALLAGILGRGRDASAFVPAREALSRMGADAWPELLRMVSGGPLAGRREAALVLAEQDVAEVVPVLLMILSERPNDLDVARELCVLTCVDLRGAETPALAWWDWYDAAPRGGTSEWLLYALAGEGALLPDLADLEGAGTRRGAELLATLLERPEAHFVERARRDLERMLGADLPPAPADAEERERWCADLRARVEQQFAGAGR